MRLALTVPNTLIYIRNGLKLDGGDSVSLGASTMQPLILSLDGNIGAGKTTLLEKIRADMPDVEVVLEPVGEWLALHDDTGKSLLELFYEDKRRWAYTFQNCALITRINTIKKAMATTTKTVIITERSVLTDRYVFAEMLRASGDLDELDWSLYMKWYDLFASETPISGIIYMTTDVATSAERIAIRARAGEGQVSTEYLTALDTQHQKWLSDTCLPVCHIGSQDDAIACVKTFISSLSIPV